MLSLPAVICQLLYLCVVVYGAPINDVSPLLLAAAGNRTTLKSEIAPGLTLSSNYRGTLDIVWSCVLTLTACIYTALHLHIPPRMSKWWHLWRKTKWAVAALFAPEIVLYTAFQQFMEARDLVKQLNEQRFGGKPPLREQKPSGTWLNTKPTPVFDLRYGFYVIMGGLTVDVEKLHHKMSHLTLTPKGVITLAKRGCFLDIRPETVSDKSKANIITKALICLQILWMVVQCIARNTAGYPLTLLEKHTMVHVFCAFAMYLLWWKKPLDINEPTILDPSNDAAHFETTALMLMASTDNSISGQKGELAELDVLSIDEQPETEPSAELAIGSATESEMNTSPRIFWRDSYDVTTKDVRRWELAYQAISKDKSMLEDFRKGDWSRTRKLFSHALTKHSRSAFGDYFDKDRMLEIFIKQEWSRRRKPFSRALTKHSRSAVCDLYVKDREDPYGINLISMFVFLIPSMYGYSHFIAGLPVEFPSRAESLLWRISCLIIMYAPCLWTLFLAVIIKWPSSWSSLARLSALLLVSLFMVMIQVFPRIFLVLESFLSLRHVPIGVYATVPWVQNIPHI